MSNEVSSARIFVCPADRDHKSLPDWVSMNDLRNSNISYFVSADTSEGYPQMILDGDDDLVINGKPAKPGLLKLPANLPLAWSGRRHGLCGNIGLADGSVEQESLAGLRMAIKYSTNGAPFSTNRIAIP